MDERCNCPYCQEGELLAKFGIKICDLPNSRLYLFKEQSHRGRVIVACNEHVREIAELSDEDAQAMIDRRDPDGAENDKF